MTAQARRGHWGEVMLNRLLVILVAVCMAGCTSWHSYRPSELIAKPELVEPGKRVRVDTSNGGSAEFKFRSIDDQQLRVDDGAINLETIESIAVRRVSTAKTIGLIAGVVLVSTAAIRTMFESFGEGLAECTNPDPAQRPEGCPE